MAGATELKLTIDNDGDLYRQRTTPIHKNLALKKAKGKYEHEKAVKLFMYLADAGAAKFGTEFNRATRLEVAKRLCADWEEEQKS